VTGSIVSDPVFWTALLGIAGIVAAFFAPPWTARRIERRRESRDFRRSTRLVADDMQGAAEVLRFMGEQAQALPKEMLTFLDLQSWEAERGVLATSLASDVWQAVSHAVEGMTKGRVALSATSPGTPLGAKELLPIRAQADALDTAAQLLLGAKAVKD
jgi:hypothetical protein